MVALKSVLDPTSDAVGTMVIRILESVLGCLRFAGQWIDASLASRQKRSWHVLLNLRDFPNHIWSN